MREEKGETAVPDNTKPRRAALRFAFRRVSHWRSSLPLLLPAVCFSVIVGHTAGRHGSESPVRAFIIIGRKTWSAVLTEWGRHASAGSVGILTMLPSNVLHISLFISRLIPLVLRASDRSAPNDLS